MINPETRNVSEAKKERVFRSSDEWKKEFLPSTYEAEKIERLENSEESPLEKRLKQALNQEGFAKDIRS